MMVAKDVAIGEAKTETYFFAERPRKRLAFEAKIGEEVWKFDFCLGEGEMWAEGIHHTFPWLDCSVTRGENTIRAGEIPFDEETAAKFEWDPDIDPTELARLFVEELEGREDRESEFRVTAALEEAIRQWGGKVAFELRDV